MKKDISFLKKNLIAHRGIFDNEKVPENSIASFKKAMSKGYTIELDVRLSKDNKVVVFHDATLKRMCKTDKYLKDLNYKELVKNKLLDTKYIIPTLEEVLTLIDGKVPVIIEIKYDEKTPLIEECLVKILDNYNGVFAIKSFNPFILLWFKKHRPNYIRGILLSDKKKDIKSYLIYKLFSLCKPDFLSCNYKLFNDKKIKKYRDKIPVICWTIRDKESLEKEKDNFDNFICEKII